MIKRGGGLMDTRLFFDEKLVSKLQNETIESVSKGRDFLRLNLKKMFDIIIDKRILEMRIFWKNTDGSSVNFVQHMIEKANLYATDMSAEISDIASLLLTPVYIFCNHTISFEMDKVISNEIKVEYEETLSKAEAYFARVKNNRSFNLNDVYQSTLKFIDGFILEKIISRQAQELFDKIALYTPEDLPMVKNAFNFAKEAHNGVFRKSGIPYISHPLSVAKILANDKMQGDIVAAALLHDVVEDTDYTLEDIANKTNVPVSNYVDAVTQIKNTAETKEGKEDADDETFRKLLAMTSSGKRKIEYALYIKAADRIHNLSTISCFTDQKQLEKVKETRTKYLRLFQEHGMNRYAVKIEDLCFKIENLKLYNRISNSYERLLYLNQDKIKCIENTLKKVLRELPKQCEYYYVQNLNGQNLVKFECEVVTEKLVPNQILKLIETPKTDINKVERYINKHLIPLKNIYIVVDGLTDKSTIRNFISMFIKALDNVEEFNSKTHIIKSIEFDDKKEHFILYVQDKYKNNVKCIFMMRKDYNDYQNGFRGGVVQKELYSVDDFGEQITVFTRDGKKMNLPKDSCAVDFAYKLHTNMGLSLYEVVINNKVATPITILHDNDQVIIKSHTGKHIKRDEVPYEDYTIEVNWLNYVKTESAKKSITRFIQSELAKLKK